MPNTFDNEIQSLLRLTANVTEAFTAALFMIDGKKRDRLVLTAFQSLSNSITHNVAIRVGHGLVGWVAKHERPTNARNFHWDATTLMFYSKDENLKSFAAAPLFHGDRLIGVLSVDSKQEYVFTDKKLKLLNEFAETFARVVTLGKKRIRLGEEAANVTALAELAEMISACQTVSELAGILGSRGQLLIPHDQMVMAVRSASQGAYRLVQVSGKGATASSLKKPLPLTHYRLGWVIRQHRAISIPRLDAEVIPDDNKKWRSFIGAPMISRGLVTGAIGLMARKPGYFRQADIKALCILSAVCSSTLMNLYLCARSQSGETLDRLTGAADFRKMIKDMGKLPAKSVVAMVNLKNFTRVNDELGLKGGDSVLMEMTRRLMAVMKNRGTVARYYGDRFVILMKKIGKREADGLLRKALEAIGGAPFHAMGVEVHIVPAIGAASCPEEGDDLEKLLLKAQRAANVAKASPGARVLFHGASDQPERGRIRLMK